MMQPYPWHAHAKSHQTGSEARGASEAVNASEAGTGSETTPWSETGSEFDTDPVLNLQDRSEGSGSDGASGEVGDEDGASEADTREPALRISKLSIAWSSYTAPVFDLTLHNPELWVRFEDLLLRRTNWLTLSEHGFPPPYHGGSIFPHPSPPEEATKVATAGGRLRSWLGGDEWREILGSEGRKHSGVGANSSAFLGFKRPKLRRLDCVGDCCIHFVSEPLDGLPIVPPIRLNGTQLTALLDAAFDEWGEGEPLDFEEVGTAIVRGLSKALMDKLVDLHVTEHVLDKARTLQDALKAHIQEYFLRAGFKMSGDERLQLLKVKPVADRAGKIWKTVLKGLDDSHFVDGANAPKGDDESGTGTGGGGGGGEGGGENFGGGEGVWRALQTCWDLAHTIDADVSKDVRDGAPMGNGQ